MMVGFQEEVPGLLGPDPSDDEEDEFNDAEEVRDDEGMFLLSGPTYNTLLTRSCATLEDEQDQRLWAS